MANDDGVLRGRPARSRRPSNKAPRLGVGQHLPSRRALTGGVLIAIAAAGVLSAHRSATAPPSTRYVVVTSPVNAGHRLEATDLGSVRADLPEGLAAIRLEHSNQLVGRTTRVGMSALSLVRPGDLHPPGRFRSDGSVELALELEPARGLAGAITPGDLVDVLATDPDSSGTRVVARGARVTDTGDGPDAIGAAGRVTVRLELSDRTIATAVVDAAVRSDVSLVVPAPDVER
jgi:Flp pilus assembly protein CpaB